MHDEGGGIISWIRHYLLSVAVAAIICAIIKTINDRKDSTATIIRLLAGIFMTVTVFAPLAKLELSNINSYIQDFSTEASSVTEVGVLYRRQELSRIIKSQTETYILDKAASLGVELQADVTVSENDPPIPCAVTVQVESAAPYVRERLSQYIANELGIPEAQQKWV